MVIELDLVAYKANKFQFAVEKPRMQELFSRRVIDQHREHPTRYHQLAKRLRHSTWKRQESHNKQLQNFLDRERYQQNQTWQQEYDRLRSTYAQGLQPHVNDRLQDLTGLIQGRMVDKLQWTPAF